MIWEENSETTKKKVIKISQNASWERKNVICLFSSNDYYEMSFCALGYKSPYSYKTTKYKVYSSLFF